MTIIISTSTVKRRFDARLSKQIDVCRWITSRRIPSSVTGIQKMLGPGFVSGPSIILFIRYGTRSAADFPDLLSEVGLVSLFMYTTHGDIDNWLDAIEAYKIHRPTDVYVLSMMKPFYMKWANRFHGNIRKHEPGIEKHLPDLTTKADLSRILSAGCRLGIYIGHGRSRGWSGYRGIRYEDLDKYNQKAPIGTMISLSCSSLKNDKELTIPLWIKQTMTGRNCTFLGSVDSVKIRPLEEIGRIFLECLALPGVQSIEQLIFSMSSRIKQSEDPQIRKTWSDFRLFGNPAQLIKSV